MCDVAFGIRDTNDVAIHQYQAGLASGGIQTAAALPHTEHDTVAVGLAVAAPARHWPGSQQRWH
eukprot:8500288-Alexandrium_andersonii.AAC.1